MFEFTEADIIAAFTRTAEGADSGDGMTLQEIVEATGLTLYTARMNMRRLVKSGAWEVVKAPRAGMTGVTMRVFAYRPKENYGDNSAAA